MSKIIEQIEELEKLLQLEKEADLEEFKSMIQSLPLKERQSKGFCWYPVRLVKKGYTFGDRAFVVLEKEKHLDTSHHFRSGKVVNLFSLQTAAKKPERSGVIHFVDKNRMKIILNSKDLPEWIGLGMLGVDLLFDETTYLEMEKALASLKTAKKGRIAELRAVLLGLQTPLYAPQANTIAIEALNPSQNSAVKDILSARDVSVIHGPPGTGKTTTLVQAISLLSKQEATLLVTAPSNTAVDLLTERIAAIGLNVTRIGNISRVDEQVIRHTLELKLSEHPDSKNIKKIKIQAAKARRKAQQYKRRFGHEERQQRRQLFQEAKELSQWANQLEDRIIDQILDGSNVITATLVGAAHKLLANRKFKTVIIDEAAQALEPATWIPILKSSRVILAGDPHQLPPTVKSAEARKKGFSQTLIEKLLATFPTANLLNVQYRMHEQIMGFSNRQFYNNQLRAAENVRDHTLAVKRHTPVLFIDTAGCGFEEKLEEKYKSRYNPEEFLILREHLLSLVHLYDETQMPFPETAIISPYRQQVIHMKQALEEEAAFEALPLTINTIDGFQGQERDLVYISLVRSNSRSDIGFLKDYRRMNVAMTRARKQLVVIGDSSTIGDDRFYNDFLHYCEIHGTYQSAWEYMRGEPG
jgi:ATP-dependent RNA/DNA helicase IGHMBP2